ncbi:hypothetical protein Sjap_008966 [Stephania japonica]|uniref:Uncharacterized protein n=1 Tax=Stephania japonica TaxID=461633 RepID=A0AAP0JQN3_9MAGN
MSYHVLDTLKENKMVVASHVEVIFYLLVMDILLLIKIEAPMAWQRHQISSIEALKADLTNHNNHSSLSYQLWSNSPALYLQHINGLRSLAEREQSLDFLLHFICRVLP